MDPVILCSSTWAARPGDDLLAKLRRLVADAFASDSRLTEIDSDRDLDAFEAAGRADDKCRERVLEALTKLARLADDDIAVIDPEGNYLVARGMQVDGLILLRLRGKAS